MSRAAKLTLLIAALGVATAGCTSGPGTAPPDAAPEEIRVPFPAVGHAADYVANGGTFAYSLRVDSAKSARDSSAQSRDLLPIRFTVAFGGSHAEMTEWFDRSGAKALVTSSCPTLALGFLPGKDDCDEGERAAAAYDEWGLPGALGASWLWGQTLTDGGRATLRFATFGHESNLTYAVSLAAGCAELTATTDTPDLFDQRFSGVTVIARRLVVCDGEAFPREAEDGRRSIRRTSMQASEGGDVGGLHVAADPWALPPSRAAGPLVRGMPAGMEREAGNLTAPEAFAHLVETDPEGRALAEAQPWVLSRATFSPRSGWTASTRLLDRELIPGTSDALRSMVLEAPGGRTFAAQLRETCADGSCTIEVIDRRTATVEASVTSPEELVSILFPDALGIAGPLLASPEPAAAVGTVVTEQGRPDVLTDGRYLFRFAGVPAGGGPAEIVLVDGLTGRLLKALVEREHVTALTGLAAEDL